MRNIWNVLSKEVKRNFRNTRTIAMLMVFPIILMIVLGTALSGQFDSSGIIKDLHIKVLYLNQGDGPLNKAFEKFIAQGESMGMDFQKAADLRTGKEILANGGASGLIKVDSERVVFYKTGWFEMNSRLVANILKTFLRRYTTVSVIAQVDPSALPAVLSASDNANHVTLSALGNQRRPKAIDYFAVTMLTMIGMYAGINGSFAVRHERNSHTLNRLLSSPVRRYEILSGKLAGTIIAIFLQMLIVIFISKYLLNAYWGQHIWTILAIVASEIMMTISAGMAIAFLIKSDITINSMLNAVIPVFVFLGGGYTPIDNFGKVVAVLSTLSPIHWINKAIFQVIYNNDFSGVITAVGINLAVAAVCISAASFLIRKEA